MGLRAFRIDGEEFAEICHWGSPDGPQFVDIGMVKFSPAQARKLAAYLIKAADEVTTYNRKRKRTPRKGGRSE